MDTNTPAPNAAAAALASAHAGNRNLSPDPKHLAVIIVWDSVMRGARNHCEANGGVAIHNVPHIVSVTGAGENTGALFTTASSGRAWSWKTLSDTSVAARTTTWMLRSGAGAGPARFILDQTDSRECVPCLINRNNVI